MDNLKNINETSNAIENDLKKNNIYKLYPLFAFLLNALIFFIVLCAKDIIGENNYSIMRGDLFQQYVAFITDFLNSLQGESSFWYSFSNYIGSGSILTNAYYALNPFNFLFLLAGDNIGACAIVIIILKMALASGTFVYFLQKNINKNNSFFIILGLFYGLSGYSITLHYNLMWLDAIYILPILIHLIIKYIKTNKFIGLTVLYVYIFITNFYIAYMAGIFSALFFVAYLLLYYDFDIKNNIKMIIGKCLKFAFSVILAVGLCAFVLLSTFGFLSNHMADDNFEFLSLSATLLDFLNSFFIGEMPTLDNKVPFLYCGIPTIALMFLFFISKKIDKKMKIAYGALILFYIICMIYMPLYQFMHAFDYPNYYAYRFSFVLVFMNLYLAAIVFEKIDLSDLKFIKIFSISAIVFYSFMMTFQKILYSVYNLNTQEGLIINALFIILWYFLAYKKLNNDTKKKLKNQIIIIIFSIILCSAELFTNAYMVFDNFNFTSCEDNLVNEWYYTQKKAVGDIKASDDDFYRIYINNDSCLNSGKMFGYNSLNTFSSADNYALRNTLSKMGMSTSNRVLVASSYIPGWFNLLGVKYKVDIPAYADWKDIDINATNYMPATVTTKDNVLGLGYMVNEKIFDFTFESNAFNNTEKLCNYMTGLDEDIYKNIDINDVDVLYVNYECERFDDRYMFVHKTDMISNSSVMYYVPTEKYDENIFIHIYQDAPESIDGSPEIVAGENGFPAIACVSAGGVYKLYKDEDDLYKVAFVVNDGIASDFYANNLSFSVFDEDAFSKIYDELSKNQLEIIENTGETIVGKVIATEDKNILFTSIPYDKEWVAYVDGIPVSKYLTIGDAFMALKLEPGEHVVAFQYVEEYSSIGAIITLISVLIFVLLLLINVFRKNDEKKKDDMDGTENPDVIGKNEGMETVSEILIVDKNEEDKNDSDASKN